MTTTYPFTKHRKTNSLNLPDCTTFELTKRNRERLHGYAAGWNTSQTVLTKRTVRDASRCRASRYTLNNLYDQWWRPPVTKETCSVPISRNISPPGMNTPECDQILVILFYLTALLVCLFSLSLGTLPRKGFVKGCVAMPVQFVSLKDQSKSRMSVLFSVSPIQITEMERKERLSRIVLR